MEMYILSVLVSNKFGTLTRVTNLFSRRGFNIKELTVGETENPEYSRITIVTEGNESLLSQIQKQLSKLYNVESAAVLSFDECVSRELLLIKLKKSYELFNRLKVTQCNIVDDNKESVILEITGTTSEINEFIEEIKEFGILEICRTGVTALQKGRKNILKIIGGK